MLTEQEALERILRAVIPLPSRLTPLSKARGLFAAKPVHALVPLPGFNNSAMDGYALRAQDSQNKQVLRVIGEQPAGERIALKVEPGAAVRIFTGAPLPEGADAVIMQEDVARLDGGKEIV